MGILFAIAFYNLIHHFLVAVPTKRHQLRIKRRTDRVVRAVIEMMAASGQLPDQSDVVLKSNVMSSVWGRDIFVYEYHFNLKLFSSRRAGTQFLANFKSTLAKLCRDDHLFDHRGRFRYRIADEWTYHDIEHLDVASLVNLTTVDYLADLRKLKKSSGD